MTYTTARIEMTAGTDYPYTVVNAVTGERMLKTRFISYTAAAKAAAAGFLYLVS